MSSPSPSRANSPVSRPAAHAAVAAGPPTVPSAALRETGWTYLRRQWLVPLVPIALALALAFAAAAIFGHPRAPGAAALQKGPPAPAQP